MFFLPVAKKTSRTPRSKSFPFMVSAEDVLKETKISEFICHIWGRFLRWWALEPDMCRTNRKLPELSVNTLYQSGQFDLTCHLCFSKNF